MDNNKLTIKEAINMLKNDMEMSLFDPLTGKVYSKEELKIYNKDAYEMYLACELAIEALREQAIREFMKKNCVLCGTQSCDCHFEIVNEQAISNCGNYNGDIEGIPKAKSTMEIFKEIIEEAGITWDDIIRDIKGE